MESYVSSRERFSSKSSKSTRLSFSSNQVIHMGWLQQKVPTLLFSAWQPRFCLIKTGESVDQDMELQIYKTEDTIHGDMLMSITLNLVYVHEFHEPSKLAFVLEICLPSGASTYFAVQHAKAFKTWISRLKSAGASLHGIKKVSLAESTKKDISPPGITKPNFTSNVKCIETFLGASHYMNDEVHKNPAMTELESLLESWVQRNVPRSHEWTVNGKVVHSLPHQTTLQKASPFEWTWNVVDIYVDTPHLTTFRWKYEGYFTGTFDGQVGDGQLLLIEGFGHIRVSNETRSTRLELYYNTEGLINGLRDYAVRISQHKSTTQSA